MKKMRDYMKKYISHYYYISDCEVIIAFEQSESHNIDNDVQTIGAINF